MTKKIKGKKEFWPKIGSEVSIVTKNERKFEGIFFKFVEGYLYIVQELGIVALFPKKSIKKMTTIRKYYGGEAHV